MKALSFLVFASALFAAASSQAGPQRQFSCFTKYYTANVVKVGIKGDAEAPGAILNIRTWVNDELSGFTPVSQRNPNYNPRKYKGYQAYVINTGADTFGNQTLLLPENLTVLSGTFDGYLSDGLADGSGSNGMYRLLCAIR